MLPCSCRGGWWDGLGHREGRTGGLQRTGLSWDITDWARLSPFPVSVPGVQHSAVPKSVLRHRWELTAHKSHWTRDITATSTTFGTWKLLISNRDFWGQQQSLWGSMGTEGGIEVVGTGEGPVTCTWGPAASLQYWRPVQKSGVKRLQSPMEVV